MHGLWHWILYLLTWASHEPASLPGERARAAGAVNVAYAALATEPAPAPRREPEAAPVPPQPPRPPAAPCVQCSGTGRIYRSDGGWVRCPCQCQDRNCKPAKVLP